MTLGDVTNTFGVTRRAVAAWHGVDVPDKGLENAAPLLQARLKEESLEELIRPAKEAQEGDCCGSRPPCAVAGSKALQEPFGVFCDPAEATDSTAVATPDLQEQASVPRELPFRCLPRLVSSCAADLQELWMRSAAEHSSSMQCALQKFSRMGHPCFAAALKSPPAMPPPFLGEEWAQAEPHASALEAELRRFADAQDDCEEMRADACLQDFAPALLRACHLQSEQHVPCSGEAVCATVAPREREQIILWLLQVGMARALTDEAVFAAVLMFDRYCAQLRTGPVAPGSLHLVVTAILSVALKVTGPPDDVNKVRRHRDLLADLGRGQFTAEEVFKEEVRVTSSLEFNLTVPTSLDFLRAFLLPFSPPGQPEGLSPVTCLARFLLQLSLAEPSLQYRYPHAVLAAGSVYVALWCTRAQPGRVAGLLGDLAASVSGADGP